MLNRVVLNRPWHDAESNALDRNGMVKRILHTLIVYSKRSHQSDLSKIAQRLEWKLYHHASSLAEYRHPLTLKRRLHLLAFSIAGTKLSRHTPLRKDPVAPIQNTKFCHSLGKLCHQTSFQNNGQRMESEFLLNNNGHLVGYIFTFVDTKECVKHQSVNRFLYRILPKYVRTLTLNLNQAQLIARSNVFHKYPNVEKITIFRSSSNDSQTQHRSSYSTYSHHAQSDKAWNPLIPRMSLPTEDDYIGVSIVNSLILAIQRNAMPSLHSLTIQSCLLSTSMSNAMYSLIESISLPHIGSKLTMLSLPGNCGGDVCAKQISDSVALGKWPKLTLLDLRNNFIGVEGGLALSKALGSIHSSPLNELRLGTNLLTDEIMNELLPNLTTRSQSSRSIRYVGLEDNFFSESSITMLQQQLKCYNIINLCVQHNVQVAM